MSKAKKKTRRVLCFGNEALPGDSLAIELADELHVPGYEFVKCGLPLVELLKSEGDVFILDVVEGIKEPVFLKGVEKLEEERKLVSLHDLDAALYIKLLKEIGNVRDVYVIGVPATGDRDEIKWKVEKFLTSI